MILPWVLLVALLVNVFAAQAYPILLKIFQMTPVLVKMDINGTQKLKVVTVTPPHLLFSFIVGTVLTANILLDLMVILLIIMHAHVYSVIHGIQEK